MNEEQFKQLIEYIEGELDRRCKLKTYYDSDYFRNNGMIDAYEDILEQITKLTKEE